MDIGNYSIKLVTGKFADSKVSIDKAVTILTPQDCFEDGKIINMLELKEVLKRALEENKIDIKSTISSIESTQILTREIVLPSVSPEDMKEMINYEIGEYLPIELDKYVVQFKVIEEFIEEDVTKQKILVAAVPAEIALNHFELIDFLGLNPVALDIHSNVISKLFHKDTLINNKVAIYDKTVAVLDIGHSHINVIIIDRGEYKFNRIISTGATEIDTIIASYLNINLAEAREMKHEITGLGIAFQEEVAVAEDAISLYKSADLSDDRLGDFSYEDSGMNSMTVDAIRSTMNTWVDEINKVFKYYTSRFSENTIDNIYLYGGSAQLDQIASHMDSLLNIPTDTIYELNGIEILDHSVAGQLPIYLNAIGAIIRR